MSAVRFVGAPPPVAPPEVTYQVLRPQRHGPLDLTILADMILGVVTHFVVSDESGERGTRVCWQHEEAGCRWHDEPMEWAGFLPVWDHKQDKPAVLRLAPRESDAMLEALGVDLRWLRRRVAITPYVGQRGKAVKVALAPAHQPPSLGQPFSIVRTVCCVLGCARIPRQSPAEDEAEGGAR